MRVWLQGERERGKEKKIVGEEERKEARPEGGGRDDRGASPATRPGSDPLVRSSYLHSSIPPFVRWFVRSMLWENVKRSAHITRVLPPRRLRSV